MSRCNDRIKAQPCRYGFDIWPVGCCGENQCIALCPVAGDLIQRAFPHVLCHTLVGLAFDMRLQSSASDIWSDHQRLIDFLELLAWNEPQNIDQHDAGNDKREHKTPWRHMTAGVHRERRKDT